MDGGCGRIPYEEQQLYLYLCTERYTAGLGFLLLTSENTLVMFVVNRRRVLTSYSRMRRATVSIQDVTTFNL